MVPEDWKVQKISECLERVVDAVAPEPDKFYREIGIRSHAKGIFHKEPVTGKSLGDKRVFNIYPDCFVVNIVFAWEQAIAMTSNNEVGMIASHRFPMFRPKKNRCDISYITYFFKTLRGKYLLELASPGGAGRNKTLGQNEFAKLEILLPPPGEQRRIAQILSTWDRAIEVTEKLLSNSQQQKKALMQQLLIGKKCFPGFSGEWESLRLGKLTKIYDGTHSTPNYVEEGIPFYSVEHVTSNDFSNTKYISPEVFDKENKRVQLMKGDILMTRIGDIGTAKYLNWDVQASFYVSLALIKSNNGFSAEFLSYYIAGKNFQRELWKRIIHVAFPKKINLGEIGNCIVFLPSLEEQQKIASILSAADKEIEGLQQKLDCLRQEKKALMQQLLTGKRRVKVDEEEISLKEAARA